MKIHRGKYLCTFYSLHIYCVSSDVKWKFLMWLLQMIMGQAQADRASLNIIKITVKGDNMQVMGYFSL